MLLLRTAVGSLPTRVAIVRTGCTVHLVRLRGYLSSDLVRLLSLSMACVSMQPDTGDGDGSPRGRLRIRRQHLDGAQERAADQGRYGSLLLERAQQRAREGIARPGSDRPR